jgi:hypothetical protein
MNATVKLGPTQVAILKALSKCKGKGLTLQQLADKCLPGKAWTTNVQKLLGTRIKQKYAGPFRGQHDNVGQTCNPKGLIPRKMVRAFYDCETDLGIKDIFAITALGRKILESLK